MPAETISKSIVWGPGYWYEHDFKSGRCTYGGRKY